MRFVDFLKVTVLLSAGVATGLAALTVASAHASTGPDVVVVCAVWWAVAGAIGLRLGARAQVNPPIGRLLSGARVVTSLPEPRPTLTVLNRLWPLLLAALVAAGLSFWLPQVSGVGAGFAIIWAMAWRRQESAVTAIEDRDGAQFYVERTSPFRPMVLLRTTGFRAIRPVEADRAA